MKNQLCFLFLLCLFSQCTNSNVVPDPAKKDSIVVEKNFTSTTDSTSMADAPTILSRKQVPVLCYHHIKEVEVLPKSSIGYTVTAKQFKNQLKALSDSGYHTVLPEQVYHYLAFGKPLPEKPVMITYDDTDEEQFSIGKNEMDQYGYKGVYFIMTISINRPRYMSTDQIKKLSDEGHVIASHTWDHSRTDRYITGERMIKTGNILKPFNDWDVQLTKTKIKLEDIIGKKVDYFAYPFGVWNASGIPEIKKRGYLMAFQLATRRDTMDPLYTVRRIIVAPSWNGEALIRAMKSSFK